MKEGRKFYFSLLGTALFDYERPNASGEVNVRSRWEYKINTNGPNEYESKLNCSKMLIRELKFHHKLKLISMDDKSKGILMNYIGFHLLTEVSECPSARKVWKILKKKTKLKGKCIKEIHTITFDFKTGMEAYLLEHDRLRKKIIASTY